MVLGGNLFLPQVTRKTFFHLHPLSLFSSSFNFHLHHNLHYDSSLLINQLNLISFFISLFLYFFWLSLSLHHVSFHQWSNRNLCRLPSNDQIKGKVEFFQVRCIPLDSIHSCSRWNHPCPFYLAPPWIWSCVQGTISTTASSLLYGLVEEFFILQ